MRLLSGKTDIGSACATEQILFIDAGFHIFLYETPCPVFNLFPESLHAGAIAVNRLHRTPELIGNTFHHHFFHTALTGNFKSSFHNHIFCNSLFGHCNASI